MADGGSEEVEADSQCFRQRHAVVRTSLFLAGGQQWCRLLQCLSNKSCMEFPCLGPDTFPQSLIERVISEALCEQSGTDVVGLWRQTNQRTSRRAHGFGIVVARVAMGSASDDIAENKLPSKIISIASIAISCDSPSAMVRPQ